MNTLETITSEGNNNFLKGGTTVNGTRNISLKEVLSTASNGTWVKKFRDPSFIKDLLADLLSATFVFSMVFFIGMHIVHIVFWS